MVYILMQPLSRIYKFHYYQYVIIARKSSCRLRKIFMTITLTPKQRAFVDHYVTCRNGAEAARRAGYAEPSARITAAKLLTKANIQSALAEKEAELKRLSEIDKNRVIAEIIDGIHMARIQGQPASIITGWINIAKMLGLYELEQVNVNLSAERGAMRAKFEALSDEELLAISAGSA